MRFHSPRRLVKWLAAIACLALLTPATRAGSPVQSNLASQIDALLALPEAARAHWGISVTTLDGQMVYEHNAGQLFTPASNAKLFTTAAALALLGPQYRFRTTVESTVSPDQEGTISGDLRLVGRGDPNLSGRILPYALKTQRAPPHLRLLDEMAGQVAKLGVRLVLGDLVADDSYFLREKYGAGWSYDDLMWEYGAPASALTVNDNEVFLTAQPGLRRGESALISIDPAVDYYVIQNGVTTSAGGTKRDLGIDREPGSKVLKLWGTIPLDDKGQSVALSIEDPADFAGRAFRQMLEAHGVTIRGQTRLRHLAVEELPPFTPNRLGGPDLPVEPTTPVPVEATYVLAEHQSNPLIDDLTVINKVSQNLHGELLLRTLGKERGGSGSIEGGAAVIRKFLEDIGIGDDEFVFYDASGLSREDLVTPGAITKFLRYAAAQPWGDKFRATLPVAAVDGSLSDRFKASGLEGRVQAKTGTMGGVAALSGFLQPKSGPPVAFSILVNNHRMGDKARDYIDKIVALIGQ